MSLAPLTTLAISDDLKYDDEFMQTAKVKIGDDDNMKDCDGFHGDLK